METTYLIGIFRNNSQLECKEGLITLTTIDVNSTKSPGDFPFLPAREREGTLVIIKGVLKQKTLHSTAIIEAIPNWTSEIITGLVENKTITWEQIIDEFSKSRQIIIGPKPVVDNTSNNLPKCALVVGHRKSSGGAESATFNTNEFEYNKEIAKIVKQKVTKAKIEIVFRDDHKNGYMALPAKINALNPKFIVSLHFNAFSKPSAKGTETLYFKNSTKGHKMALALQRKVIAALGLSNRHTKGKVAGDRGAILLKNTNAPCIITEPFFVSNPNDEHVGFTKKDKLIQAYVDAIEEIAGFI